MKISLPASLDGEFDHIDLTHRLRNGMAVWPTHPIYRQDIASSPDRGDRSCNHALCLSEHTGTHFDAPLHFIPGGRNIADVPVPRFFGRMVMLDCSDALPDSEVGIDRIIEFERRHGAIAPGDAVAFQFGWGHFWNDPEDKDKILKGWPGLSREASLLLIERQVRIVATDCLSIDRFGSQDFPAHNTLLGADILIGENFANLHRVPPICFLVSLPLAIDGGSGSPLRAIALVPRR